MQMRMRERLVNVPMRVWFYRIYSLFMRVLIFCIVNVAMGMLQPFMRVFVGVALRKVRPYHLPNLREAYCDRA